MKYNTQNQNTINQDQPVELTIAPDFQTHEFVIAGDFEAVAPYVEAAQAYDAKHPVKHTAQARKAGHSALESLTAPIQTGLGRVGLDIKTIAYDKVHGTSFYDALRQKREDERNLRFATSIGLISLTDVACRKHEHAIAKMRGL